MQSVRKDSVTLHASDDDERFTVWAVHDARLVVSRDARVALMLDLAKLQSLSRRAHIVPL